MFLLFLQIIWVSQKRRISRIQYKISIQKINAWGKRGISSSFLVTFPKISHLSVTPRHNFCNLFGCLAQVNSFEDPTQDIHPFKALTLGKEGQVSSSFWVTFPKISHLSVPFYLNSCKLFGCLTKVNGSEDPIQDIRSED